MNSSCKQVLLSHYSMRSQKVWINLYNNQQRVLMIHQCVIIKGTRRSCCIETPYWSKKYRTIWCSSVVQFGVFVTASLSLLLLDTLLTHFSISPFPLYQTTFSVHTLIFPPFSPSLTALHSICQCSTMSNWEKERSPAEREMVWAFTTTGSVWPHTAPATAAVTRSNTALIERHAGGENTEEEGKGFLL